MKENVNKNVKNTHAIDIKMFLMKTTQKSKLCCLASILSKEAEWEKDKPDMILEILRTEREGVQTAGPPWVTPNGLQASRLAYEYLKWPDATPIVKNWYYRSNVYNAMFFDI